MSEKPAAELKAPPIAAAQSACGHSTAAIYEAVKRQISPLHCNGTAIDFGAGEGALSRLLCEQYSFQRVIAIDRRIGPYTHERLIWVPADLNLPLLVEDNAADLILSVEVIEHLENPWAVAREWFRILKPGGRLILSTPNNESWTAIAHLIFKNHFNLFLEPWYPDHINALLKMDVSRILQRAGFQNLQFSYTNEGMLPKWVSLTWQKISLGLLSGRRYSDNLVCVAQKPVPSDLQQ